MNTTSPRAQEIINITLALAEEGGVASLTTARLAGRMAFTEPALYRYFPNKAAIMGAALRHLAEHLFATMSLELTPRQATPGPAEQLRRHVKRFALRNNLALDFLVAAANDPAGDFRDAAGEFLREYAKSVEAFFAELRKAGTIGGTVPAAQLARSWIEMILGTFVHSRLAGKPWDPAALPSVDAFLATLVPAREAVAAKP